MNLLFAINRNFTRLLCVCLHSIVKNGGASHYTAYILHSDLGPEDMATIRRAAGENVDCRFLTVEEGYFDGFPESRRYPRQIYYRLAAPLLLPETLERVLYLDVDTVVIHSLEELYQTDFQGNYYVACSHVRKFLTRCNHLRLGTARDVPYINTGVLLLNLPLLRENLTLSQLRQVALEKMDAFLLPDQDLLTVLHGGHIRLVDSLRYNLSDRILRVYNASPRHRSRDLDWVRQNTAIIHYCGKNKPWQPHYRGILGEFYWENADSFQEPELPV